MAAEPTLTELRSMSLRDLESLWLEPVELAPPEGIYRGHVLTRLDTSGARRPLWFWSQRVGFEWMPFGIDFDRRLWFFFTAGLALGRFEARPGPSRWRDTDALGLHYTESRLPRPIRRHLYDEVKPLSPTRMLGLGGINADRGEGDHFYFVLERLERRRAAP